MEEAPHPLKPPLHNTSSPRDKEPNDLAKLIKWQEERIARKLRGDYESAVLHLSEVVSGLFIQIVGMVCQPMSQDQQQPLLQYEYLSSACRWSNNYPLLIPRILNQSSARLLDSKRLP
jgi:hypothetical protein